MTTITALNNQFSIKDQIVFEEGGGGLPVAVLTTNAGKAVISLYGAHVQHYIPTGEQDLLWMSAQTAFEKGKAIRGGIPVCFPWFGPHATDNKRPQHGFARLSDWEVKSTEITANGDARLILQLQDTAETRSLWSYSFVATLTITVGAQLDVALAYTNTGDTAFDVSDALHTYFNISDTGNIQIEGLQHATFQSHPSTEIQEQPEALLSILKEENRRYLSHSGNCIIHDNGFNRKISVAKTGSNTTVVWNPGPETTKGIADISNEGYKTFVCVEPANAFGDTVKLLPRESHTITTTISLLD